MFLSRILIVFRVADHAKHFRQDLSRPGFGDCICRLLALGFQWVYPVDIDFLGLLLGISKWTAIGTSKDSATLFAPITECLWIGSLICPETEAIICDSFDMTNPHLFLVLVDCILEKGETHSMMRNETIRSILAFRIMSLIVQILSSLDIDSMRPTRYSRSHPS